MTISFYQLIINNKIYNNLILTKLKINNSKHKIHKVCTVFRINITITKVLKKIKIIHKTRLIM